MHRVTNKKNNYSIFSKPTRTHIRSIFAILIFLQMFNAYDQLNTLVLCLELFLQRWYGPIGYNETSREYIADYKYCCHTGSECIYKTIPIAFDLTI